jgi:hypothetical protein
VKRRGRQRYGVGAAIVLLVLVGCGLGPLAADGLASEATVQKTNVSAGRGVGLGACCINTEVGFLVENWVTDTEATCTSVLAPVSGGEPSLLLKVERKLVDTSYLDGYIGVGAAFPIGGTIDWQRFDGSIGIEWSLPSTPEFTVSAEVGLSMRHYASTDGWNWKAESFVGISVAFYPWAAD